MNDTCINCGKWKGLHKWDTMQCPFDEKESGLFMANQFYAEENAELAALRAENERLHKALSEWIDTGVQVAAERDELREALNKTLVTVRDVAETLKSAGDWVNVATAEWLDKTAARLVNTEAYFDARAVLAKYPRAND